MSVRIWRVLLSFLLNGDAGGGPVMNFIDFVLVSEGEEGGREGGREGKGGIAAPARQRGREGGREGGGEKEWGKAALTLAHSAPQIPGWSWPSAR